MKSPLLPCVLLGTLLSAARAADHTSTWNNTTGNWSDTTKWSTPTAPGTFPNNGTATYDAVLNGGSATVDVPITIEKLALSGGTNTGAGSTLTTNDLFTFSGGTLNGSGTISAAGFTWTNGDFGGNRSVSVSGAITLSGPLTKSVGTTGAQSPTLTSNGTADLTGGNLQINSTGTGQQGAFVNNGIFNASDNADLAHGTLGGGGTPSFTNTSTGVFNKSGPGTFTHISSGLAFTNDGTVNVVSGNLEFQGGTIGGGGFYNVNAGAALLFTSGTTSLPTTSTVSGAGTVTFTSGQAILAGSYNVTGTTAISGGIARFEGNSAATTTTLNWTAGQIGGDLAVSGVITLSGAFPKWVGSTIGQSAILTSSGIANLSGDNLQMNSTGSGSGKQGVFVNSGTFNVTDGADVVHGSLGVGTPAFNNTATGTFNKSGAGTVTHITGGLAFTNDGTVNVDSGALEFQAVTISGGGLIDVDAGATLQFTSGATLSASSSISGVGNVILTGGGEINRLAGSYNVTGVTTLSGGNAEFNGASGASATTLNWTAGNISGGNLAVSGLATLSGPALKWLGAVSNQSATFTNNGTTDFSGGDLQINSTGPGKQGVFINNGTFNAKDNADLRTGAIGGPGAPAFTNTTTGILDKSGPSTTTTFHPSLTFTTSGIVRVTSGILEFGNNYTQTAGALVLNGGSVTRNGGIFTITGGKIQGGGTITGAVTAAGGTVIIEPGIGSTTGTLAITGDLSLTGGSKVSFDIGGPTPGAQHDKLTKGGSSALSVGGVTLEVNQLNGYIPAAGETITVVEASTSAITGSFANVANGARLTLTGGLISCQVNYGSATAFPANNGSQKVILSHFATTPGTLTLDDNQILENAPGGTTVGLLGATDPDTNETFIFSLVSGTGSMDNALFSIAGNVLKIVNPLDFEGSPTLSIRLRVTNSRFGFLEQAFTIQVLDVPAPTALALSGNSIFENQAINMVVGAFNTTDPTPEATFTYALVSGAGATDNTRFNIDGGDLRSSQVFNKEAPLAADRGPFSIRMQVTNNGGETFTQVFSVTVLDQGPSNLSLSPSSIPEGRPLGTTVGTFSATVAPVGTEVTYSLVIGIGSVHNAQFTIDGTALKTAVVPDFAAGATRSIRVRATGPGTEIADQAFTITIIEAGPPTDIALSANTIAENLPEDTVIGTLSATDPDPEATFTFALVDTANFPDNAKFNLSGTSLRNDEEFDFEIDPGPFDIRLRVTNSGGAFHEETFAITVTDQGPTALALSPATILEGRSEGTLVGELSGTVVPGGTAIVSYELVAGEGDTHNTLFGVDGTAIETVALLDFETEPTLSIRVEATDANGETFTQIIPITVGNTGITDITLTGTTVPENLPAGELIANLGAVLDPAVPGAAFTFSIVSATPNDAVVITGGNQLVTSRPLLLSETPNLGVRLSAERLGESFEKDVIITVNANAGSLQVENPPGTAVTTFSLGDVVFGSGATASGTVTLRNTGQGHVFNVGIRNPVSPLDDHVATSTGLATDNDLAPGESVTVDIEFTPLAYGSRNTSIIFESDNAPDRSLAVTGRGIGPEISVQHPLGTELVDGAALDFGSQPFGVSFPARTFTIKNVGVVTPLNGISATITGPDATFFALYTQGLATSRAEGLSSTFRVTFQPQPEVLRTYNATLIVASNDLDEDPFEIPLTGEGVTPLMIAQTAYERGLVGTNDDFGRSVAVSGDTVIVGAASDDGPGGTLPNSGCVYVYVRDPLTGEWSEQTKLRATEPTGALGSVVAISGDTIVTSAGASGASVAFVFQRTGSTWAQQARLEASNAEAGDNYGSSVAISGDTIVVGASSEDSVAIGVNGDQGNNNSTGSGAAYVFHRSGAVWSQQAYLKASNTGATDGFGTSVAISADTIIVGAAREGSAATGVNGDQTNNSAFGAGAAYVFQRSGTVWSQQAYLKASNTESNGWDGDQFGRSVSISGDTVIVGAAGEDSADTGVDGDQANNSASFSGAAYVFQRNGTAWSQQAYLKASNTKVSMGFGSSVAVSGDLILVGGRGESSASIGINGEQSNTGANFSGAAYLFQRTGNQWSQQSFLKASDTTAFDLFGEQVALDGDTLAITADRNGEPSGKAYIFEITSPQVFVHDGGTTVSPKLSDNQSQAVDYSPTPLGIPVTRSFTINNVRALPLTVSGINASAGYNVLNEPTIIPAQGTAVFSVRLNADTLGTNSGNVTITTNDSANPDFVFPITGEVLSIPVGSFDPRFGTNGVVKVDFSANEKAFDMLRMPDGRLVLGGESVNAGVSQFALARLNSDGSPDTSFNGSGKVLATVPGLNSPSVTGICLQGESLVAVGTRLASNAWSSSIGQASFALARFLPDGSLDSTFGTAGIDIDSSLTEGDFTWNIVANPSGKLLVAGMHSGSLQAYVRRFNQNGGRDAGFGTNGTVLLANTLFGGALTVNAGGEVFAGGSSSGTFRSRLSKLNASGTLVGSVIFPKAAPVGYPIDPGTADAESATSVVLQSDGKPVIAASRSGSFDRDLGHGFITGRATTGLGADTTFNGTGVTIEDIDPLVNREQANSIALQADGKLVVVGQVDGKWVVVRYSPTGEIDTGFGTEGKVVLDLGGSASAYKVLVDAAGDIYVAGHASNGTDQDMVVVKLIGSIDHEPGIIVRSGTGSAPVIVNGQPTPITFGAARVGSTTVNRSFGIQNLGNAPLTIDSVTVPGGFVFSAAASTPSIAAGETGRITVQMPTNTLGTFSGPVTIHSNDPNQGGVTFPITGQVVSNSTPVYVPLTLGTVEGKPVTVTFDKLLRQVSDPNGDPIQITGFSAISADGFPITEFKNALTYTQTFALAGIDQFTVTFSDGEAEVTGIVTVNVATDTAIPKNVPKVEVLVGGNVKLTFSGAADTNYSIQQSPNNVNFTQIGTAKTAKGNVVFTTTTPPPLGATFRIRQISLIPAP